jgi:hypothetical protein
MTNETKPNETKKEEYDGRKDLVSKVLEIASLTITIVLGLVTIGQITLESGGLRLIIMVSSIFLALSIFFSVLFLWFSPSYETKIEPRGTPSKYASEPWTYVSFRSITWKALTTISKIQIVFFFLGMLFLLFALLWRLGLVIPFDC